MRCLKPDTIYGMKVILALNLSQLASKLDLYAKLNNKQINNFNVSLAKFQEKFKNQVVLSVKLKCEINIK